MKIFRAILKSLPAILASVVAVVGITYAAGSLTAPSGTPTNTSYALQDIYNLASGATTTVGSGAIPATPGSVSLTYPSLTDVYTAINTMPKARPLKTFGTSNFCTNTSGVVISCTGTGQDGETNAGIPRSYTDNSDGTISDNNTGLMWQKCTVGRSGTNCGTGSASNLTLAQATSTCAALSLGGQDDWRLPNRFELQSIQTIENRSPTINTTYFPNTSSAYYHSSSVSGDTEWTIDFSTGPVVANFISITLTSVRCVRGGL